MIYVQSQFWQIGNSQYAIYHKGSNKTYVSKTQIIKCIDISSSNVLLRREFLIMLDYKVYNTTVITHTMYYDSVCFYIHLLIYLSPIYKIKYFRLGSDKGPGLCNSRSSLFLMPISAEKCIDKVPSSRKHHVTHGEAGWKKVFWP